LRSFIRFPNIRFRFRFVDLGNKAFTVQHAKQQEQKTNQSSVMLLKIISALFVVLSLVPAWAMKIGVGIADTTGPSVEINFMGYALPSQRGTGILQRLRARAYAFEDDTGKRVMFINVDGGMASDLVTMRVVDRLKEELGEGVYTFVSSFHRNCIIISIF
jgi:hypothetical protein